MEVGIFVRIKLFGLTALILVLIGVGMVTLPRTMSGSGVLAVRSPETVVQRGDAPSITVPSLIPPDQSLFAPQAVAEPVVVPDGWPIAEFATLPSGLQALAVYVPPILHASRPDEVAFVHLGSVRYTVSGHPIFVTTYRPSTAAASRILGLGNQTVHLRNGSVAWIKTGLSPEGRGGATNDVVQMHSGLLITVASDLPVAQLQMMAADVVVQGAS